MPQAPVPIAVDTDIGTNVDDCLALAYLLREPRCELLGITTVTGEPLRRAALAAALCRDANRPLITICPGAARPRRGAQQQTLAPQADLIESAPLRKRCSAAGFLGDLAAARPGQVTLLAIGPLTNLARLMRRWPERARQFKRIVVMGGCFSDSPSCDAPETNMRLDPQSAEEVFRFAAEMPRASAPWLEILGYETTAQCSSTLDELSRRCDSELLTRLIKEWADRNSKRVIGMHDALAAIHAMHSASTGETPVRFERGAAKLNPEKAATSFIPDTSGRCAVAARIDCLHAHEQFFAAFSSAAGRPAL